MKPLIIAVNNKGRKLLSNENMKTSFKSEETETSLTSRNTEFLFQLKWDMNYHSKIKFCYENILNDFLHVKGGISIQYPAS